MKLPRRSIPHSPSRRTLVIACLAIFLLAFSVRLLTWHDTRLEVAKVQSEVTKEYQRVGQLLRLDGLSGLFSASSELADPNHLGHPPGYSILLALTDSFAESSSRIQFVQVAADSLTAVLIFLIVGELFALTPAVLAGAFAALSPQLAWNSVLLLPDSLAVFPILLSIYLLTLTRGRARLLTFVFVGALVGISCWLRANALLLMFFIAAATLLLHGKKQWNCALAVICGTLLIILPLTLRNAIVFHRFIPVSLGAGQTLLEGIADYDKSNRFGIPNTDMGIMRQEAEMFQRPDYYGTLFNPDGVERERARLKRGAGVIASHPFWFATVMIRRGASMTKLERARRVSTTPSVTHSFTAAIQPVEQIAVTDLLGRCGTQTPQARVFWDDPGSPFITFVGDSANYGNQVSCYPIPAVANMDCVLELPIKIEEGRMRVSVIGKNGEVAASEIAEPSEVKAGEPQPIQTLRLPFVSATTPARLTFSNEASQVRPIVRVGTLKLYELGPARFLWTRYLRIPLRAIQRIFITAVFLPLAILGLGVNIWRKRTAALIILSTVPVYYFTVQSVFHTEYRYVLAVNYFLFAFAAVGICWLAGYFSAALRIRTKVGVQ